MNSPECNSGRGMWQCFNNHGVVEHQCIGRLIMFNPFRVIKHTRILNPEFHSGLFIFDPYQGQDVLSLTPLGLKSGRHYCV
jgi:hypothetical protein